MAVLECLATLEANPLVIQGTPLGPGFPGRYFSDVQGAPVLVTWFVEEVICVVTLLQIENIPA